MVFGILDLFFEFEGVGWFIFVIVVGLNGGGIFVMKNGDVWCFNLEVFFLVMCVVDVGLDF